MKLRDELLRSYVTQWEGAQSDSSFQVIFHWNNWEENSTLMNHLALPSTLFFISPNCFLLKVEWPWGGGWREMGLQTWASVLILQQVYHGFTNSLFFFTSKILGWLQPCPNWISMWYLFGKKASQAKELLSQSWMMAWSGITQTSMKIMWVWTLPWLQLRERSTNTHS